MTVPSRKVKATPVEVLRRERLDDSVTSHTTTQYRGRWKMAEDFRVAMGKKIWDKDLFVRFLAHLAECGYASAEGFRSAILHFGKAEETGCLREPGVIKMTKGVAYQGKALRQARGTLTKGMFEELVRWLSTHYPHLKVYTEVLFGAQLRISEARWISKGDWRTEDGVLFLRKDKRYWRDRNVPEFHEKPGIDRGVSQLLTRESTHLKQGERLFKTKWESELRKAIKSVAKERNWPKDVDFVGPHSPDWRALGGTQGVLNRARKLVESEFAQQSQAMVRHYSKGHTRQKRPRDE